jgi:uncharacterized protein YfaS (alpha-2-macroglobulin family)
LLLMVLVIIAVPASAQRAAYAPYSNPNKVAAMKPNLDLYVYRRCYTPSEKIQLNLSGFNVTGVRFAAYNFDLGAVVQSSRTMVDFGKIVRSIDLEGRTPVAAWWRSLGKTYPDQWSQQAVDVPELKPGIYLIVASAAGIEKRTWFAVTRVALVTKRSRQELLVYAADVDFGNPVANLKLGFVDESGHRATATTGSNGILRVLTNPGQGNLWIEGDSDQGPAFALAGVPSAPDPFTVFTYTDRPIYRPGNLVQFKSIVRQRFDDNGPGGFTYRPCAGEQAIVEIRDGTDALIERKAITTNQFGTLAGSFQLASEPTLGNWRMNVLIGGRTYYGGFIVQAYRKPEMTVNVTFDKQRYLGGNSIPVTVDAQYYFGRPVSDATVAYSVAFSPDDGNESYQGKGVTDSHGQLHLNVATQHQADDRTLSVNATVTDLSRRSLSAEGETLVTAGEFQLSLSTDKDVYKPGKRITVTVQATDYDDKPVSTKVRVTMTETQPAHPDAWALVTVEGERLGTHQVIHLTKQSTVLHVPLSDHDFPSICVEVAVIQDRQIYEQEQRLTVDLPDQKLSVSVRSDKDTYQPGDTATYTVTTRDWQGRPAAAEVSLGVVDASVYAIEPDNTPDMESSFYGGQDVRVETGFSFAAEYSGGGFQTVPGSGGNAPGKAGIRVRKQFADTAYWNPIVDTGPDGTGTVSFTVPDNLTTWRATAHAVTMATAVGSATHDVIGVMPLTVRLELPRFTVSGDRAVVSAIVQNGTKTPRTVQAKIEAEGATLTGDAERTLQLDPGAQQRLDWDATITGLDTAQFTVTADGGPGAQDATESSLPVLPDGLKMVTATADVLSDASAQDEIDLAGLPKGATLQVTLSPSIGSAMLDAVDSIAEEPSGNAEETISSFLPDIALAGALSSLHSPREVRPDLDQWISLGLQKLYRYQHPDGGWNWWEFDQTDGDMTAYVLYGLVEAKAAGFTVDDQRILRGKAALESLLGDQEELGKRADWLLTLSYIDPEYVRRPLAELYAHRDKLDLFGEASLALALAQAGDAHSASMAHSIASDLAAKAVIEGRGASWPAPHGGCYWRDDDVCVTAHVLRALIASLPDSQVIPKAALWLMANREGAAWDSSRAGAEAVLALAQYMAKTGELNPSYTATVLLDGQQIGGLMATAHSAYDSPKTITLTPDRIAGHSTLTVDKQGAGVVYVSKVVSYLIPEDQATEQSRGISVHRQFQYFMDDPSRADPVGSGTQIDVQLDINADADYRYVTLEEPIPAGCEVEEDSQADGTIPLDFSDGDVVYPSEQVRDDRIEFDFDSLPKGRTRLTYRLDAETPGSYHILPGIASLNYFPEMRGNSALVKVNVGEADAGAAN